jgi:hypothetical protein
MRGREMFILESSIPNKMNNIYSSERSIDGMKKICFEFGNENKIR